MSYVDTRSWIRPQAERTDVSRRVDEILGGIEREGEAAVAAFSTAIDGFAPTWIPLEPFASYDLPTGLADALGHAADRIRAFAERQRGSYRDAMWHDETGAFGQRVLPVASMGAYIPGGRFPLVSSALMTLIPATVAGVRERIAVSPDASVAMRAAASLAGATAFLRVGGAQAIGALALGAMPGRTAGVDVIVGPGNDYVATAKARVADRVRIDSIAGPSELLSIFDGDADARWIAADLLAQAEHDPAALSVGVAWSADALDRVRDAIGAAADGPAWLAANRIQLVRADHAADAVDFANRLAAEHLHVATDAIDPADLRNFGSLFLGARSGVAFGDYCSGPNHTLPTGGGARRSGGLGVGDFLRVVTVQRLDEDGVQILAPVAAALAEAEGLDYHRRSVTIRHAEARLAESTDGDNA